MTIKILFNKEFITYLLIGAITAIIYYGVIVATLELANLDYRFSVTLAYICAVLFHFIANRTLTFNAGKGSLLKQGSRYIAVLIVNYLITIAIVYFCVVRFGLSTYLGVTLSIATTMGIGYIATKFWVFRNKEFF